MGGFVYAELAARMAEQAALAGGGLSGGINEIDESTTIDVTTGNLTLAASEADTGVIALQPQAGLTIVGPVGSAMVVQLDGGDETLTWQPGSFQVSSGGTGTGSTLQIETDNAGIFAGSQDAQLQLQASGAGNCAVSITASSGDGFGDIIISSDRLGFYGSGVTAKPAVPAVPTAQDIVNALVSLGLISQSA